jgi:hypothetical protein
LFLYLCFSLFVSLSLFLSLCFSLFVSHFLHVLFISLSLYLLFKALIKVHFLLCLFMLQLCGPDMASFMNF